MNIGIVVLNWNNAKDTNECLVSLNQIHNPENQNIKILVVDNASTDNSYESIAAQISVLNKQNRLQFSILKNSQNEGFSGGNNRGIRELMKEHPNYIMVLNSDVIVDEHFLANLIASAQKHNAIVGPKIYFAPGYEFHHARYSEKERGKVIWYAGGMIDWSNVYCSHRGVDEVDQGQYNRTELTKFISGCCMLINRTILETIGFFDDNYFLYYEDVDLCLRAKQKGIGSLYEPSSKIWHKNAQSSGKSGSSLHVYYQTRNRMIFGFKYASFKSKLALIKESMHFIKEGGVRKQAVLDFYLGKYGRRKQ